MANFGHRRLRSLPSTCYSYGKCKMIDRQVSKNQKNQNIDRAINDKIKYRGGRYFFIFSNAEESELWIIDNTVLLRGERRQSYSNFTVSFLQKKTLSQNFPQLRNTNLRQLYCFFPVEEIKIAFWRNLYHRRKTNLRYLRRQIIPYLWKTTNNTFTKPLLRNDNDILFSETSFSPFG